jgi:hypothetical protein
VGWGVGKLVDVSSLASVYMREVTVSCGQHDEVGREEISEDQAGESREV